MLKYDVIIVGAGPSGCASALELLNLDPGLAGHVLLLDKAVFPRTKLCAGGLSADADLVLEHLGINLDLHSIPVHKTSFVLPSGRLILEQPSHFRVIRREQFDHALFQSARKRGVIVQDGELVERLQPKQDEVIVQTSNNRYRAKIVIAADGANSTIRANLGLSRVGRIMVAMEFHVPTTDISIPNLEDNMSILDLSLLNRGVPGYCWVFPAVVDSPSTSSVGIFGAPFGTGEAAPLREAFGYWLATIGLDLSTFDVKAHPILRYEPKAICSSHRVLFVGDAAGVDPLFGEGISSALALGVHGAQAAHDALRSHDFSFSKYERRIRNSSIGSMIRRRYMIARRLYSHPKLARNFLQHGTLLRGIALLGASQRGVKLTWEPLEP